ncbi:hypothetical protein [Modestobacter marinus]|uniref:hypothetical protein n=1 Tax=Modestobacter marinus TaxID=477641 RepID=UPI001C937B97|nr:hypothetical protein [Modestobacter marinus]
MTTYRTLLAAGAHPTVDPRRAAALRTYLRRLASSLTPSWRPTEERDDFGWALLAIAARLGEETTRRLDQTPERDAIAFFDFLGLPPMPPRAATGVLAMALAEGALLPVVAPVRTQVEVTAGDDDVPFETLHKLRIVPGRIAELVAVDPATDHIELAPAQVTALERPAPTLAGYSVVAAAAAGSATLQLSPTVGLAPEDVLRIGTAAYRISTVDKSSGIVTLHDELEAPVAPDTTVTRIATFTSFTLRDQQGHAFYVGHSTLFDLKQRATISLVVRPPHLARELARLDVDYAMWGTKEGASAPDWHPLVLLGTTDGTLELRKPDAGTVEEVAVDGRKSRWLRAQLPGPVSRLRSLSSPVAQIQVSVASAEPSEPGPTAPAPATAEGSGTIAQAFYNGTPLSTARRFFPFGPEPLRFDTFALAAPEALSKKGATATVDIRMVDSSLATFDIVTVAAAATVRGYGVGLNGDLQALTFRSDGGLRWNALPAISGDGRRILLAGATALETATTGTDLVVAVDRTAKVWAATIKRTDAQPAPTVDVAWKELPDLEASADTALTTTNGRPPGPVLAPAPSASELSAVLFGVAGGKLHALKIPKTAPPVGGVWQEVAGGAGPTLDGAWRLTPVQGPDWPGRPEKVELVALAPDGALWLGGVSKVETTADPPTVTWNQLDGAAPAADDIAPAATRFRPPGGGADRLWIAYARRGDAEAKPPTPPTLQGLLRVGEGTPSPHNGPPGSVLATRTALHANPGVYSTDDRPVTVGLGANGALVWRVPDTIDATPPPPRETPTGRPLLLPGGTPRPPEVVLGGTEERLFRAALVPLIVVDYALHNVVTPDSKDAPHWVEIGDPPTALVKLDAVNRQFVQGTLRVYRVDVPLEVGASLTFLQRVKSSKGDFTGTVDPADRTLVTLDTADTVTKVGARLIIDEVSYRVDGMTAATPPVATLSTAVLGNAATVVYEPTRPIQSLAGATVRATDVATLAELTTTAARVSALRFRPPADPVRQEPSLQGHRADGGPLRVLVAEAWKTQPPLQGLVQVLGVRTDLLEWTESALERGYQNPELSWEYYDGEGWRRIATGFVDGTVNLSRSGCVQFEVPDDLATTDVGGKTDYWIRARLIGGDYGRPSYVVVTDGKKQTVTIDTADMHPPEILSTEASFVLDKELDPEVLLVENNLDVRDQTQAAVVPEARFDLFQGAVALYDADDADRAVYVGLTGPIGRGSLSLLVDATDQDGTGTLTVDLRTADGWRAVGVDDRTAALRRRGMLTLTLEVDPVTVRLFGTERVWLRCRPAPAEAATWAPKVRGLFLNAVEISQARTVQNEVLGSSLGEPALTVVLAEAPVLPDTVRIRVRERLSDEERAALEAAQKTAGEPGREPPDPVVVTGIEQVPGAWVLWRRVDSLIGQSADARVYVLDPGSGRVTFGDGRHGKIPPAGRDCIRAFAYQQGGGEAGNVAAWSEAKVTSAVEGVDTVVLPVDAAGGFGAAGAASEVAAAVRASLLATAPDLLRHAGQGLSPADIEALAVASATDVVRARCARPTGPRTPITVTLSVRDGDRRRPVPTLARRDAVAAFLRDVGWGALGEHGIDVTAPTYVGVAVRVDLVAARGFIADVEDAAKAILTTLFHPVDGGPDGTGWPFGRTPTDSDVLRALHGIAGLDRVSAIALTPIGASVHVPDDGQVTAEPIDITVVVTTLEGQP